jgi:hypothetical protein
MKVNQLVGQNLKDFKIVRMSEVYRTDDNGIKSSTVGFFKDSDVAEAYIENQKDSVFYKLGPTLILTDGAVGFVLRDHEHVTLMDDKAEAAKILADIEAKMPRAHRKLLAKKL